MTSGPVYPQSAEGEEDPSLAVRRKTDRCFFAVEELAYGPAEELIGYVVEGILWPIEEIAETRALLCKAACPPRAEAGPPFSGA